MRLLGEKTAKEEKMKAIDTHVHPGTKVDVIDCGGKYIEDAFRFFGSDHPFLSPARWLADFEKIQMKAEVKEKILLKNAQKLFGL